MSVGVYIPIIRISIKGGMTIPKKTRLLTMAHMFISFHYTYRLDPDGCFQGGGISNGSIILLNAKQFMWFPQFNISIHLPTNLNGCFQK